MTSRNKREGYYTGQRKYNKEFRVRAGVGNGKLSWKKFRKDWYDAMSYIHWQDGIIEFHPLWVEVKPDYLED